MLRASGVACALVLVWAGATPAMAGEWAVYEAPRYGFSMLVPQGTQLAEREAPQGWGCLHAEKDGVQLYGYAELGWHYTAEEIEAYGVKVTGIAAKHWKHVDAGQAARPDWTWYKTVRASDGENLVFGIYGIGPRGSYLLLLRTTVADFQAHEAAYRKWYESLKLHGGWTLYRSDAYGFQMIVPEQAKLTDATVEGWGMLRGSHQGTELYGLAKLGLQAEPAEIEAAGAELTGVPAAMWKQVAAGKNQRGWGWYRVVRAEAEGQVMVGIYGTGAKGSYLLVLTLPAGDYQQNKACYDYWYESLHVDG